MPEAVRLLVWDLDETFWKGTLTEGGITEYVQANHDIVIELARRGIMSSICSKNDEEPILRFLAEKGIAQYFVFPSISWEPKGQRLKCIIDAVQLRPATVMFIDDNPGNRAEVARMIPELQVVDDGFISQILGDPRFKGKDDVQLTRLAQYKLLETRRTDEIKAVGVIGNNEAFLRACDVRVYIEYDVVSHLDRAIELINRTNQLNFTKLRLPEETTAARERLREDLRARRRQAGLVHVMDKYGDYGFVGFFMLENRSLDSSKGKVSQALIHYCFSCRTLGMLVEHWLYEKLQRPEIKLVGEVLTDLTVPREIDWIRMTPSITNEFTSVESIAPEIRLHGGCEATSIVHYLKAYAPSVFVNGNFFAGAHFVRINSASLLISACDRAGPDFEREAKILGIPYESMVSGFFRDPPEGTVFIFGGQYDCPGPHRYRHKIYGWEIKIEPHGIEGLDVVNVPEDELVRSLHELPGVSPQVREEISAVAWHVRQNYESVRNPNDEVLADLMRRIFERVPVASKMLLMVDDDRIRGANGIRSAPWVKHYENQLRKVAADYSFVDAVTFTDCIKNEEEIQIGGNHYDRMVYYRFAEKIISAARRLPTKVA